MLTLSVCNSSGCMSAEFDVTKMHIIIVPTIPPNIKDIMYPTKFILTSPSFVVFSDMRSQANAISLLPFAFLYIPLENIFLSYLLQVLS